MEALRALTIARNIAVKATTTASNQIKTLRVGADQELRDRIVVKSLLELATRCSQLSPVSGQHAALSSLGRHWLLPHQEVLELDRMIRSQVRRNRAQTHRAARDRYSQCCTAAHHRRGSPGRLHSDAGFAALCGVSPIQASSGQTHRHRLSRGGDGPQTNPLDDRQQPYES